MPIAVTGSIATDHLTHFPGRFADQLLADQIDRVSLSFLVDDLVIKRGGVAGNIALRARRARARPAARRRGGRRLRRVPRPGSPTTASTAPACWSATTCRPPASCAPRTTTCARSRRSTPARWPGPARSTSAPVAARGLDIVLIGANDPEGMLRHTDQCRELGIPFAADPSQQLARMEGPQIRAPRRRCALPAQQRLRVGAAAAEDRLDRGRRRAAHRHPDHHAQREGRRDRRPRRHRAQDRRGARDPAGRPHRRRRRLPGRLPRRASTAACRWSVPRSSAR